MRRSKYYNMRLPERGAREGEANDAADIEDLTYDLEIIDKEMERQRLEDVRMEKEKPQSWNCRSINPPPCWTTRITVSRTQSSDSARY